ncbi:anti-sigma factor family protein [Micromonospora sp. DT44]|uniref:anti-sigma factor family protein n=1 Tax=Micromonospora sp. DT44 TaxID=3393439 RepID=UPI003CF30DF4
MGPGGEHATEEQPRLALYLLGVLDEADRVAFEEHLAGCWRCLNEATEVGASTSGLAGLADVDWELPVVADPPPSPAARSGGDPAGSARPAGARPGGDRPAGARPDRGPTNDRGGARRRRIRIWGGAAAAVLALALAGGVVVVNERGDPEPTLTASGEAPAYGASLSVLVTTDDSDHSTIRITVTGLRPGLRYRLYAVTRDGVTHTVRDWLASNGPQKVTGETALPIDELAFITVGTSDGVGVVTAPITRGAGSPR